ncbi:histidinol-phosphate aminotransferase family protein [Streptomyces sp. JJ36]|nr:histidinol-phosphate aminotransferase family protein [Streptomyces sp. JJ36]
MTHSPSWAALDRLAGAPRPTGPPGTVAGARPERPRLDFCIPCNPYFPPPEVFDRLRDSVERILRYYPSDAGTVTAELCRVLGLNRQTVVMGNGSTELITWIDHLLVRESLAVPVPTFGRWTDQPMETGKRVDMFPLREEQDFALDPAEYVRFVRSRGSRVAVLCNPNNPDGGYLRRSQVLWLLDQLAALDLVVVDESFIDFVDAEAEPSVADEACVRHNVVVLKSLGKNFGLHGVRFGYLVANPALAATVRDALPKWNLNAFAETVVFLLGEYASQYRQSLTLLSRDRSHMSLALAGVPGLVVFLSQGNFLLVRLPAGVDGVELRDRLLTEHGIFVRECGNKLNSSSRFLRLVVRPAQDVDRLVTALRAELGAGRAAPAAPPVPSPVAPPGASSGPSPSAPSTTWPRPLPPAPAVVPCAPAPAPAPALVPARWPGPGPGCPA